jgi:hypothetical protein
LDGRSLLQGKFGLTVNKEKTKIVDLGSPKQEVNFLGFAIKWVNLKRKPGRKFCFITPSSKSLKKAGEKIKEQTCVRKGCHRPSRKRAQPLLTVMGTILPQRESEQSFWENK